MAGGYVHSMQPLHDEGVVTMTYFAGLRKYVLCISTATFYPSMVRQFDTYFLESDSITGFTLVRASGRCFVVDCECVVGHGRTSTITPNSVGSPGLGRPGLDRRHVNLRTCRPRVVFRAPSVQISGAASQHFGPRPCAVLSRIWRVLH